MARSRHRSYCFTSFLEAEPCFDESKMKWLIYAPEVCPMTGKDHWQGFVQWKSAKSMKASCRALGGVSCQVMRGTFEHQLTYIQGPYSKDGKEKPLNPLFQEYGTMPQQGQRKDLEQLRDDLLDGTKTVEDILVENPLMYHQYGRTMQAIAAVRAMKRRRTMMTKGIWLFGSTGTGKSHAAWYGRPVSTVYGMPDDKGWWDLYDGQPVVVMDDFRGKLPYEQLLKLVDKWHTSVSRRGQPPMPFTAELVIVTSSLPPELVYKRRMAEDSLDQLYRRFTVKELYFDEMGERAQRERFAPEVEEVHMNLIDLSF